MAYLMHLARYTLPPAFSIHITGLFASVYLLVIKDEPLRGGRKIPLQLVTRVIEVSRAFCPCWPQRSSRERHFRYNAVKHPHAAVTTAKPSTRTMFVSVALQVFDFSNLLFEFGRKVSHTVQYFFFFWRQKHQMSHL